MARTRWKVLAARLIFLGYVFFTAAYCLLCYIPFTYQQVHVGELLPWLTRLVHLHALLFWPAFCAALFTVFPESSPGAARKLALGFAFFGIVAGVLLAVHPLLPAPSQSADSTPIIPRR